MSATPDFAKTGTLPAVVAVSEGAPQPEVLRSQWDPGRHVLTAQTEHLSFFQPILLDLARLGQVMANGLNGYLGLASGKPDCVGQTLSVGSTTYRLDPTSVPAAWPCLSRNGDQISVDLTANSPMGWLVHSRPVPVSQGPEFQPDVGQLIDQAAYQSLFAPSVGKGTVLLPGGTTHLRFDPATPPEEITLRADPGATLLNGLVVGMHALFPKAKIFDIPGVVGCLKPIVDSHTDTDMSGADIGSTLRPMIDCVTGGTDAVSGKPVPNQLAWAGNIAAKSLGAVLSLGPDVANQLAATLAGLIGEFTGKNFESIAVLAERPTTTAPTPSVIDRLDVTTWAYNRVQGDTYTADNTGGKQIEVFWKSFAGTQQVRTGCKSTVHIEGPGTNQTKEKQTGCDSYDPGTFFKLSNPGVFTITVTVSQPGQPDITTQHTLTILPHN